MQTPVGRPKDLAKRKQILAAAKRLFLKSGYHGSSMNLIAQEAGVTKLTVYNHFQDKANLFTCTIAETCEEFVHARLIHLDPNCNFLQMFAHACQLTLKMISLPEAIKLEHLLLELSAEQNPLAIQFYNASHQKMQLVWQDFFQKASQLGFLQHADIEEQTHILLSLLLGHRHHEVLLGVRPQPTLQQQQQIVAQSIELFMLKYKP